MVQMASLARKSVFLINFLECVFNWQDDRGKNMRVSAPQYYDFAMTWCQQQLTNQDIFPTKFGDEFPDDYMMYIKRIVNVLWAVVCHVYHVHWLQIKGMVKNKSYEEFVSFKVNHSKELKIADQLQLIFMHLYSMSERYQLLPSDQLTKLQPLYDNIIKCNQSTATATTA